MGTGGGTYETRELAGPAGETVAYNLYADAAETEILGDGTGASTTIPLTTTGGTETFTIYGATDPDQLLVPPGTYTSTVTATVTF